ncbi:hypothetical protein, partial [Streptomyces sp. NPDC020362]|uniref:hypothetical protein n=1 Tax=Streptomyces sp. NPDC020362 TaxID=3154486 RepID=UPI0033DEBD4E
SAYAGEVSGWTASSGGTQTFTLPSLAAAPAKDGKAATAPATHPAPHTKVPAGVTGKVPYNPGS